METKSGMRLTLRLSGVHTTPEEFENPALFLGLGLPSALIRLENAGFQKRFLNRRYWNGKRFENVGVAKSLDFPDRIFFKSKMIGDWCVCKFLWVKWTKNIWSIFRVRPSFLNYSALYGRNIIVLSPYYVWHLWEFIFRFVFTILLQFTTQEVREKTIKEQENLYNSEMLRYDQRRISPHNVNAMLSVKLARIKRIVNYKTLSWCIAEFSERMLKNVWKSARRLDCWVQSQ